MKNHRPTMQAEIPGTAWDIRAFEEILACNIKDVVADLCLADADVMMSYATNRLHGNIEEIVTSSAELYFRERTLSYGHGIDVSLEWGRPPCVVVDMEFAHSVVSVFFKLVLGRQNIGVQINRMLLSETAARVQFDAACFEQIVLSARLRPLPNRFARSPLMQAATRH